MASAEKLSGRALIRPTALLLDFGGVIVETRRIEGWEQRLAAEVRVRLGDVAPQLTQHDIAADIVAGCIADSHWKDAMSRPLSPPELKHEQFWGDFVAADWPEVARALVMAGAAELCRRMGHLRSRRELRDGMTALLDAADAAGIAVGIVSNALSGQVHLDFLNERQMTGRFAAIVHSDEARVRKPNPEMIRIATRSLGIEPAEAWYVGDNFDRDVLCGVRAGIGGNVLMEAKGTYEMPYALKLKPDAIVADPRGLLALFTEATRGIAA